ncbi:uncharacterized mitochondrial protein AtMg00240-like [Tripterygium wilfordii]|uniref:uncharacterized mitochondrial protein AtMg00240-like n=1 Tax=Tripterygium wilfordii TaxID=458696 RepID=UPI0018F7FCAC|nr:uncharacterized mitochondrial protein AtMg00240-like [Tripterygium wilfordii]
MDTNSKVAGDKGDLLDDPMQYRRLVAKLMYLNLTRPDISYTINTLNQFMRNPTTTHLQAAQRVLRYLKGTFTQGLLFPSKQPHNLEAYRDADWASCSDTRRSVTGYSIMYGKSLISWKSSNKQFQNHQQKLNTDQWQE